MPYAGELPITTFFPRISASGKRITQDASALKRKQSPSPGKQIKSQVPDKKQRTQEKPVIEARGRRLVSDTVPIKYSRNSSPPRKRNISSKSTTYDSRTANCTSSSEFAQHSPSNSLLCSSNATLDISQLDNQTSVCSVTCPNTQSNSPSQNQDNKGIEQEPTLSELPDSPFAIASSSQPSYMSQFVESSQSQIILQCKTQYPLNRRSSSPVSTSYTADMEEIIPSSQTQDMDSVYFSGSGSLPSISVDISANTKSDSLISQEEPDLPENITLLPTTLDTPECPASVDSNHDSLNDELTVDDHTIFSVPQSESEEEEHSLSRVVMDFHDMFGDTEGSYPDDFPLSLR